MLRIEGLRETRCHQAQLIERSVQRLATETEQATELAAADQRLRQLLDVARRADQADHVTRTVGRGRFGRHHGDLRANDELLAAADKHVVAAIGIARHRYLDELIEVGNQLVALVVQVVGRLAADGAGRNDLFVQVGNLLGVGIDLTDGIPDLGIDPRLDLGQALVHAAITGRHRFGCRHHGLACRDRRRIGGHGLRCIEKLLHQRRQPGFLVGQHVVDLRNLGVIGVERTDVGLRIEYLGGQRLAEHALDRDHMHPLANAAGTGHHTRIRRLEGALAGVPLGAEVGNVVSGSQQAGLSGIDAGHGDTDQTAAHEFSPSRLLTAQTGFT